MIFIIVMLANIFKKDYLTLQVLLEKQQEVLKKRLQQEALSVCMDMGLEQQDKMVAAIGG